MRLIATIAWLLLASLHASDLAAWPKSHSMTFWTQGSTPYTGPVPESSMAAGTKGFRDECARTGKPMEMVINLAVPWHWDGAPLWQDASEKVVDFWWKLGVRGVLLEKPEARPADSTAYQSIVATGKAWLARGGNLYVILEGEAKGVALAREWDSARTWVYGR